MKKNSIAIIALLSTISFAKAQNTYPWPSAGNIGIGTYSPGTTLDVQGSTSGNIVTNVKNTGMGRARITIDAGGTSTSDLGFLNQGTAKYTILSTSNGGLGFYDEPASRYSVFIAPTSGNVGIGTTSPSVAVDVIGQGIFTSNQTGVEPTLLTLRGTGGTPYGLQLGASSSGAYGYIQSQQLAVSYTNTPLAIQPNGGKVGIGTTNPDELLSVKGVIHGQEVKVDLTGWSDYVFKPTYKLPPLSSVKSYIDQNQHLPEVPSENEMVKNGLNIGEMNRLLMKKVEELTLYLIKEHETNELAIRKLKQQLNNITNKTQKH